MFVGLSVAVVENSCCFVSYNNIDDHANEDAYHALALLMVLVAYVLY